MLGSFIQQGKADGMQLMDDALFELASSQAGSTRTTPT